MNELTQTREQILSEMLYAWFLKNAWTHVEDVKSSIEEYLKDKIHFDIEVFGRDESNGIIGSVNFENEDNKMLIGKIKLIKKPNETQFSFDTNEKQN